MPNYTVDAVVERNTTGKWDVYKIMTLPDGTVYRKLETGPGGFVSKENAEKLAASIKARGR